MYPMGQAITALALTLLGSQVTYAQPNLCSSLLNNGVFESKRNRVEFDDVTKTFDWMCDSSIRTESDADDTAASVGLPVGEIPVQLGYDRSKQSFSEWKRTFCSESRYSSEIHIKQDTILREASSTLVKGFNDCLGGAGLHVWREPADPAKEIVFAAKYKTSDVRFPQAEMRFRTRDKDLRCEGIPATIGEPVEYWTCTRLTPGPITAQVESTALKVDAGHFVIQPLPSTYECVETAKTLERSASAGNQSSNTSRIAFEPNRCEYKLTVWSESRAYSGATGTVTVTVYVSFNGDTEQVVCGKTDQQSGNMSVSAQCDVPVPANTRVTVQAGHSNSNANIVSTELRVTQHVVDAREVKPSVSLE